MDNQTKNNPIHRRATMIEIGTLLKGKYSDRIFIIRKHSEVRLVTGSGKRTKELAYLVAPINDISYLFAVTTGEFDDRFEVLS
jgi:hypothetical protein